jgi:hypothetical protein
VLPKDDVLTVIPWVIYQSFLVYLTVLAIFHIFVFELFHKLGRCHRRDLTGVSLNSNFQPGAKPDALGSARNAQRSFNH